MTLQIALVLTILGIAVVLFVVILFVTVTGHRRSPRFQPRRPNGPCSTMVCRVFVRCLAVCASDMRGQDQAVREVPGGNAERFRFQRQFTGRVESLPGGLPVVTLL